MQDPSSVSSRDDEPQGRSSSVIDEKKVNPAASSEPLEVQIANRAYEISQRGSGGRSQSLASWLVAAREVLSGDPEGSPSH
ncbi:MAG: hypothetical protein OEZ41_02805 [Nitrospirota bacterium]|nr:hypothetical protein [Nitrospirota bacterium]MDH5698874.1 hypothetical protein [Nitrospirota bacterium]